MRPVPLPIRDQLKLPTGVSEWHMLEDAAEELAKDLARDAEYLGETLLADVPTLVRGTIAEIVARECAKPGEAFLRAAVAQEIVREARLSILHERYKQSEAA